MFKFASSLPSRELGQRHADMKNRALFQEGGLADLLLRFLVRLSSEPPNRVVSPAVDARVDGDRRFGLPQAPWNSSRVKGGAGARHEQRHGG